MVTKKALACSYSHSLQLLHTADGNQFRPDVRSEFEVTMYSLVATKRN